MVTRSSVKSATADTTTVRPEQGYCTGRTYRMNAETGETFNIESTVCGDGKKAFNSMALWKNWNASAQIDSGVDSYHKIDSPTIILSTRRGQKGAAGVPERSQRQQGRRLGYLFLVTVLTARDSKKRNNSTYVRRRLKNASLTCLAENQGCSISVSGTVQQSGICVVPQYLFTQYWRFLSSRMAVSA